LAEVFNCNNFLLLFKNKYGSFVLQKAISLMSLGEKREIKEFLTKKININGFKEKTKFNLLLEQMY
jgi:hypothetical protein